MSAKLKTETLKDRQWMQLALKNAEKASEAGEVPIGAVLVYQGEYIAGRGNSSIHLHDPTAHAEILALRAGGEKMQNYRLVGTTLYVTLEPCVMCMGAIIHARVSRLVYGASDPKTGAVNSVYTLGSDNLLHHSLEISKGILEQECSLLLKDFFKEKRKAKKNGQT